MESTRACMMRSVQSQKHYQNSEKLRGHDTRQLHVADKREQFMEQRVLAGEAVKDAIDISDELEQGIMVLCKARVKSVETCFVPFHSLVDNQDLLGRMYSLLLHKIACMEWACLIFRHNAHILSLYKNVLATRDPPKTCCPSEVDIFNCAMPHQTRSHTNKYTRTHARTHARPHARTHRLFSPTKRVHKGAETENVVGVQDD